MFSYYQEFAWDIALRRTKRGRMWLLKHGLILWHPSTQFCVAHGFEPDELVSQQMLAEAKAHWDEIEPLPRVDPMARIWAAIGWREGTCNMASHPGRKLTSEEINELIGCLCPRVEVLELRKTA